MQRDLSSERAREVVSRIGAVLAGIEIGLETVRAFARVAASGPPLEVVVDIRGLERFVESCLSDAQAVFPEVDPVEGALRLAAENLWEETESGDSPATSVGIDRDGTVWRTGARRILDVPPRGSYRWDAEIDGPRSRR